jgi:hypothetical protein
MQKKIALQQYAESDALSQSFLKAVLANRTSKKVNLQMVLGSYVDAYITCNDIIDDLYVVRDIKLTDTQYKIIHNIAEKGEWTKEVIQAAINEVGYYNNRHKDNVDEDKRIDEFLPFEDIYKDLVNGKKIVSTSTRDEAELIANVILSDKKAGRYMDGNFQQALYWEHDGVNCKGLLDVQGNNFITDLKITDTSLRDWRYIARKFRYDFQLSYYQYGAGTNPDVYIVVYSTADKAVDVFKLSELDLEIGRFGCNRHKSKLILAEDVYQEQEVIYGWEDAISIYKEAKERNLPDFNVGYTEFVNPLNIWL